MIGNPPKIGESKMLKERWSEYKLDAHERPKTVYEYFVTGKGEFPWDMLRYDSAWPATGADAAKMALGFHNPSEAYKGMRSTRLRSYRPPTIDRWSSFGWSVGTNDLG
jgi:hypothetical protein